MKQSLKNSEHSLVIDNILSDAEKLREKSFYLQSLRLFKKALQGYIDTRDQHGILNCMHSLGDIYRMVGNFSLALKSYKDTIELAKKIKDSIRVADSRIGLALALRAQGKWKESINLIRESRKTYQKKG